MLYIIRNGVRRWWWVYALAAAASVFSVVDDNNYETTIALTAGVLLYGCIMLLVFEIAGPAKFRAFGMLPVTRRQMGLAFGVLWAGLLPAFHVTVYLLNGLVHAIAPKLTPAGLPLHTYAPLLLLCTGACCHFALICQLSQRFPQGWKKLLWDLGSAFIMMGLFVVVSYFIWRLGRPADAESLGPNDPFASLINSIEALIGPKRSLVDVPGLAALGVAAAGIVLFVVKAKDCTRFLFIAKSLSGSGNPLDALMGNPQRTHGFLEPWVQEIRDGFRILSVLFFAVISQYFFIWIIAKRPSLADLTIAAWPQILIIVAGLVCIPPLGPWIIGLRTLRVLPLSRKGLALYLVSFPLLAFAAYSLVLFAVCAYCRDMNYALNMEWWMVFVFGLSLVSLSLLVQARHIALAAAAVFLPTLLTAALTYRSNDPVEAMQHTAFWVKAGAGAALIAAGYYLLYKSVARSTSYQSKPWMGAAQP
jgi:hypothetical protein